MTTTDHEISNYPEFRMRKAAEIEGVTSRIPDKQRRQDAVGHDDMSGRKTFVPEW